MPKPYFCCDCGNKFEVQHFVACNPITGKHRKYIYCRRSMETKTKFLNKEAQFAKLQQTINITARQIFVLNQHVPGRFRQASRRSRETSIGSWWDALMGSSARVGEANSGKPQLQPEYPTDYASKPENPTVYAISRGPVYSKARKHPSSSPTDPDSHSTYP